MEQRSNRINISLTSEEKKQMLDDIVYYFETERDEKLGILASEDILEFFMDTLGKTIYNKALDDIKFWLNKRIEDAESDYYALYK